MSATINIKIESAIEVIDKIPTFEHCFVCAGQVHDYCKTNLERRDRANEAIVVFIVYEDGRLIKNSKE